MDNSYWAKPQSYRTCIKEDRKNVMSRQHRPDVDTGN